MKDAIGTIVEQVMRARDLLDDVLMGASRSPSAADSINDDRLREVLSGLERAKNATDAAQAQAMVAMREEALALDAAERAASDHPLRSHEEFVPDEIAVLLSCTKAAASMRYTTAGQAAQRWPLFEAWASGSIDARKVSVIADQLAPLSLASSEELAKDAAAYASSHTQTQTREWLRRRVVEADPDAAEERRLTALQQRRVVITPVDDGMSELWALLPSVQARRMQQTLTQLAQDLGADDLRTMDQRRSDVLSDLVLGTHATVPVNLSLIMPADTLSSASNEPAWVPGLGPITADEARSLVGEQVGVIESVRALLVDPETGLLSAATEHRYRPSPSLQRAVRARDVTCRFPGCRRAASDGAAGTDLDHTIPWPKGETCAANLAVLCRRHHRLKHSAGWGVQMSADGTMTWTTPSGREYQSEPWQYRDPPDLE